MRTDSERISAMHQRAADIKIEKRQRTIRIIQTSAVLCCLTLVIVAAAFMPGLTSSFVDGSAAGSQSMSGSIFANSAVLAYIVIAILAFVLGVAVTIFCYRLKKYQTEKDIEDRANA